MRHPLSTISCIFYLIAGAIVAYNPSTPLQFYAGTMIMLLGLASGGFHWTGSYFWQKADEVLMLVTFIGLIYLNAGQGLYFVIVAIAVGVLVGYFHKKWGNDTVGLLGIIAATLKTPVLYSYGGLGCFGLGLVINNMGRDKNGKIDDDKLHAAWHLLTAGGLFLIAI